MPGGRPKFQIDYNTAEKLAGIMCTQEEIASFLGCSVDTLQRDEKFCGIYKKRTTNRENVIKKNAVEISREK